MRIFFLGRQYIKALSTPGNIRQYWPYTEPICSLSVFRTYSLQVVPLHPYHLPFKARPVVEEHQMAAKCGRPSPVNSKESIGAIICPFIIPLSFAVSMSYSIRPGKMAATSGDSLLCHVTASCDELRRWPDVCEGGEDWLWWECVPTWWGMLNTSICMGWREMTLWDGLSVNIWG